MEVELQDKKLHVPKRSYRSISLMYQYVGGGGGGDTAERSVFAEPTHALPGVPRRVPMHIFHNHATMNKSDSIL